MIYFPLGSVHRWYRSDYETTAVIHHANAIILHLGFQTRGFFSPLIFFLAEMLCMGGSTGSYSLAF